MEKIVIEVVILDIDGILTDGAVYVDASGNETKRILFDDVDAYFELRRSGMKMGFITGEDTGFCDYVNRRFSPDFLIRGCKDKLAAFNKLAKEHGIKKEATCYAGDSKKDIELLQHVVLSYAPADAPPEVRNSAKKTLLTSRGEGVIRELAKDIFEQINK